MREPNPIEKMAGTPDAGWSRASGAFARGARIDRPLILYEDRCRFCRGAARLVTRLDRAERLAILPFDDPDAAAFVVFLTDDQIRESWELIEPDGTRRLKGDAFVALLEYLPGTRLLGRLLCRLRLHAVAGAIDLAISRLRPRLARLVPDRDGPRRPPAWTRAGEAKGSEGAQ